MRAGRLIGASSRLRPDYLPTVPPGLVVLERHRVGGHVHLRDVLGRVDLPLLSPERVAQLGATRSTRAVEIVGAGRSAARTGELDWVDRVGHSPILSRPDIVDRDAGARR